MVQNMEIRKLSEERLHQFQDYLIREEKRSKTIEKYIRDVRAFFMYVGESLITKECVISYKKELLEKGYAICSINSMLASLNCFLIFCGWQDCKVKSLKVQRKIYCKEEKELTKAEYLKLLEVAKADSRLSLVMRTICSTGIRISELEYFTVEAVERGEINVECKNKTRTILIPGKLRKMLKDYAKRKAIHTGCIFITRNGKPLDRSNIWTQMKQLCQKAGVQASKVFPHNLRKLFARTFYKMEKDIAKLADVLGHSNVNTTRIYIMSTGMEHRKIMDNLDLVI